MRTEKAEINIEELKKGGVVKLREKDMFSVWIRAVCDNMDAQKLRKVADLAEKYGKGYILFSTLQFPIIPHVHLKNVWAVKDELEKISLMLDRCGKRVRNTDVFYGFNLCPYAVMDPISLGEKLDQFWREDRGGFKIKTSIAGCEKQCTSPRVLSDIGFVGVLEPGVDREKCNGCSICIRACQTNAIKMENKLAVIDLKQCKNCGMCTKACPFDAIYEKRKGISILVGGQGPHFMYDDQRGETCLGEKMIDFVTEEQALKVTEKILELLKEKNKNVSDLIDEIGLEKFKRVAVKDDLPSVMGLERSKKCQRFGSP